MSHQEPDAKIFACSQSVYLAEQIAKSYGMPLGKVTFSRYSDGEFQPSYEESIRGIRVFIVCSTFPSADNLMELLLMIDAAKRASASHVTVVVPYFGYARQDRRPRSARVAISAKVVADMISTVGIDRILTVDLHADQIQGFFNIPVDNIYGSPVLVDHILAQKYVNPIVVSPDVGGVVRARALAKRLDDVELAIIDKRRPRPNESKVMNIIGEVTDKTCVLIDDIVDTAGTLCLAAQALKDEGARKVVAYITHPILSGPAVERIANSGLDQLVVTDTIPLSAEAQQCPRIRQLSVAGLLGETIRRIRDEESVSSLYVD